MQLLARWNRKARRVERHFTPGGRRQRWTFDDAMEELERALRGLGVWEPPEGEGSG